MKEMNKDGRSASPVHKKMITSRRVGERSRCDQDSSKENKQLFCGLCRTDFSSLNSLRDHLRDVHVVQRNTREFSCVSCETSFKSLVITINHLLRSHTKEKIEGCSKCGCKFPNPLLVLTVCTKQDISERHCKKCKKGDLAARIKNRKRKLCESEELRMELRALTGETKKYNSKKRPKEEAAKEEVEEVPPLEEGKPEEDKIGCDYCQFSFPSVEAIRRHIRLSHPGKGRHVCADCGRKFLLKQYLLEHSISHLPQHHCDACNLDFATRRKLLAHNNRKHAVGGSHACAVCAKTFKTVRALRSHSRKHTERYVCDVCGREFSDRNYLGVHKRTHTGERPFPCPGCDKKFSTQRHLKTHFRTHTGEKPFACETCGRAFGRKEHLKTHLRVHTGEKPYVCDVCNRGFSQKWVMYSHRRIHTGERPFECDVCQRGFIYKSQLKTHELSHAIDSVVERLDGES